MTDNQLASLLSLQVRPLLPEYKNTREYDPLFTRGYNARCSLFPYNHYIYRVYPGESVGDFLQRLYRSDGPYHMRRSSFALIASLVITGNWPGLKSIVEIISIPSEEMGSRDRTVWEDAPPEMGYIFPTTEKLRHTYCAAEKQWCIRVDDDAYLGLSDNGPRLLSLRECIKLLYSDFVSSVNRKCRIVCSDSCKETINSALKDGSLDEWIFFTNGAGKDVIVNVNAT
jgi:hypothetical protein